MAITPRKRGRHPYSYLLESGFKLGYILSDNHDIGTFRSEVLRYGQAQSLGTACDDRSLVMASQRRDIKLTSVKASLATFSFSGK